LLFSNFDNAIKLLKPDLLQGSKRFSCFPRIWVICLSKSDLFPERDVHWFKDTVIQHASESLIALRKTLAEMIETGSEKYFSLGQDFLLLSSAKISPQGKILNAKQQTGLDLIMPLSVILPIQRASRWHKIYHSGVTTTRAVLHVFKGFVSILKYLPLIGNIFDMLNDATGAALSKLKEIEDNARKKNDAFLVILAALAAKFKAKEIKKIYTGDE
jgi:hypothetical protein